MTYKEVLYSFRRQLENLNTTVNALDQREIHLQKMVERLQSELDHKAKDIDIIELKGSIKEILASRVNDKASDKAMHDEKIENKGDNKWMIATAVTITIFVVSQIINYYR